MSTIVLLTKDQKLKSEVKRAVGQLGKGTSSLTAVSSSKELIKLAKYKSSPICLDWDIEEKDLKGNSF